MESTRKGIQKAQEQGETLTSILNRLGNDQRMVQNEINKVEKEREKVLQDYNILLKSIQETESSLKVLDQV